MADNFRIDRHVSGNGLRLKLSGDFDGSSAMELLGAIADNSGAAHPIYIETDGLREIHSFGRQVFKKKLPGSPAWGKELVFTGAYSQEFPPRLLPDNR